MYVQDPLTVVGDVHGQYYDLLKILSIGGDPKSTKVGRFGREGDCVLGVDNIVK